MRTEFDAIVVGAGPAGSSAAILLARAGWSVALIEKERFPRRKVCGECIAASNLPLLEALGIGTAFDAVAGPPLRRVALLRGNRSIEADLPIAPHAKHPWGRALGRETLDVLLLEQARSTGAEVMQPWSVQSLEGAPGAWRCRIRSMDAGVTSVLRSRVAIDAHGSWEALPSARQNRQRHRADGARDLLAFKANFRGASLDEGLLPVLSLDGGYGGMVVADGGVATVACCIRRDRLRACRLDSPGLRAGEAIEAFLERECLGVRVALQSATRDGPWLAAGPLHPGIRVNAGDGAFRIGNAAGEAHPIIGEGMSMAMQSAWLLCIPLLEAGRTSTTHAVQRDIGRRYAAAWRRAFGPRLQLAAVFAHTAMLPASAASLVGLASAWPGLLMLGARIAGKTRSVTDPASLASRHTANPTLMESIT